MFEAAPGYLCDLSGGALMRRALAPKYEGDGCDPVDRHPMEVPNFPDRKSERIILTSTIGYQAPWVIFPPGGAAARPDPPQIGQDS